MTEPAPSTSAPSNSRGSLRFALTIGAWFVGLFGLMRLTWVERNLLTPFAQVQQDVADQLTGAPSNLVYADASCSGGDPMALCMGAIFAFPATWGSRLRGAAIGLLAITALNIVRLGNLSLVAADRALLDLMHVYVWPAILILAAAGYVYWWMSRQGTDTEGGAGGFGAVGLSGAARRFMLLTVLLVVAYFALTPLVYQSRMVNVLGSWVAMVGGGLLAAAGTTVSVSGAALRTPHGGFLVTQECIFTPLIPVYLAGVLSVPLSRSRRALALLATPFIFFAVGVARLLVLAVPRAVIPEHDVAIHAFSQTLLAVILVVAAAIWAGTPAGARRIGGAGRGGLAIAAGFLLGGAAGLFWGDLIGGATGGIQALAGHGGHVYSDEQGALAILPAFQLGLFAALWLALGLARSWRRALAGIGLLALLQAMLLLPLGELAFHFGLDPHVGLIRTWAIVAPLGMVWLLWRPAAAGRTQPLPTSPLPQPS